MISVFGLSSCQNVNQLCLYETNSSFGKVSYLKYHKCFKLQLALSVFSPYPIVILLFFIYNIYLEIVMWFDHNRDGYSGKCLDCKLDCLCKLYGFLLGLIEHNLIMLESCYSHLDFNIWWFFIHGPLPQLHPDRPRRCSKTYSN